MCQLPPTSFHFDEVALDTRIRLNPSSVCPGFGMLETLSNLRAAMHQDRALLRVGYPNRKHATCATISDDVALQQQLVEVFFCPAIATEKNPGQSTLPGFYRLLPQLVGSFDPGGGVSGDGLPPGSGLFNSYVHSRAAVSTYRFDTLAWLRALEGGGDEPGVGLHHLTFTLRTQLRIEVLLKDESQKLSAC
jgi:hypothetical protein